MRTSAIAVLVIFGWFPASFAGVRIIENTAQKFSFEWTTDNLGIIQKDGAPTIISFTGENVDLGDNGEPIVPAYSFYLGMPQQGAVKVRFVAKAVHSVALKNPLRVRNAPRTGPRYPGLRFSDPWISNARYTQFGRLRSGQFFIRPFLYDRESRTVQVLDRAECTVEFPPSSGTGGARPPAASDYAHMLRRLVLNYDVSSGWTAAAPLSKRAAMKEYPLQPSQSMISFKIGDGHSGLPGQPFPEGTIDENGIIKLQGADIVRLLGSSPPIGQIALYASFKGEMPLMTPDLAQIPDGVTEVPLIRVDVNNNGIVDPEDYFLAYVSSISDWSYDSTSARFSYQVDKFDDYRHYWIAVKNSPANSLTKINPVSAGATDTLTSFGNHLLFKKSQWPSARDEGGLEWAWIDLTTYMPSFTLDNVVLPHIDAAAPCSMQVATGYSAGSPPLNMTFGNASVCSGCQNLGWLPFTYVNNSSLTLAISGRKGDTLELRQIEFRYSQKLDMTNISSMTVFSPEKPGIVRYRLSGLPSDLVYIVRIANNDASISLVDTVRGGGTYEWTDTSGIGVRYYVCTQDGFKNAPLLSAVAPIPVDDWSGYTVRNLRTLAGTIDYLIVTHPNFMVQAQRLARHKRNIGRFINAKAVSITDIYNQFSGGNTDPAALRNALEYVREHVGGSAFEYVVLMGIGHFDFRNITTRDTSFLPVAEFKDKCIEDFFVFLTPGARAESVDTIAVPNMFLGRIPCRTYTEAGQVVDKIIQMEDPASADFGGWRNRMLLVADDDEQAGGADQLGTLHMASSERIDSMVERLQPAIDMRKVYEFEYPFNAQNEKPEAAQALINEINNGVAFVNWFGHGSDNVWADEHILMPEYIGNMQNVGQYPLITSFSCDVGKFDQPGIKRCLSEYLVEAVKCGAIATASSMREAYAQDNEKLARNFYASVFDTSDTVATLGEAMGIAKCIGHDDNQKVYSYLGDPSIQTLRPARRVVLTISDNSGRPLDTLKALQQVKVKGIIMKKDGSPDTQFGSDIQPASVQISMFNPAYLSMAKDNGPIPNVSYFLPGPPIFIGQAQVKGGTFEQSILLPKTVTFGKMGSHLTAYSWLGSEIALGYKKDFLFSGFSTANITDTTGPTISVRPVYTSVSATADAAASKGASSADKISASLPFTIEIQVFDSNGVDVVSTGPDEGLTIEIPGVMSRNNIDHKFQFGQGDYRKGSATIALNEGQMTPGSYTMNVTAQDLLGNVSRKSIALEITAPEELALYHVFNYPNPMRMGQTCRFYFDLSKTVSQSQDDEARVLIRLYTLSGRLMRVFDDAKRGEIFDGRDNFGTQLSPGVYLYQVIAEDRLQQKVVKSKIEKLAINPPR